MKKKEKKRWKDKKVIREERRECKEKRWKIYNDWKNMGKKKKKKQKNRKRNKKGGERWMKEYDREKMKRKKMVSEEKWYVRVFD